MYDVSPDDTVTSRLRYWSTRSPETTAFVYVAPDGDRYAYTRKDIFSLSRKAGNWLRKRGVCKTDVILCLVPSSPEQMLVALGGAVLGASVLCTRPQYRDGSDILALTNCGDVTTVIVEQTDADSISTLQKYIPDFSAGSVASPDIPSLKTIIFCDRRSVKSELPFLDSLACEDEVEPADVSPDDVVTILATSGSTGIPKLVSKTHRQLMRIGCQKYEVLGCQSFDVVYIEASFSWITGYPTEYLVAGPKRVVTFVKDSPPEDHGKFLLDVVRSEKVTHLLTNPAIIKILLVAFDFLQADLTWRPRSISVIGYVVRKDVARAIGTLTSELRVVYGSTESGFNACKIYTDAAMVEDFNCGKPVKGCQVKVVDENLREVPPNTQGETMILHNGLFSGYLKQPVPTGDAEPEKGWYRPRDLAYVNEKGDLFVQGRQTEVLFFRLWVINPQLLESHLMECPGVYDVAIIPIPDSHFENLPCVCVVQDPRPEAVRVVPEDIIRTCAEYLQESFRQEAEQYVPKVCLVFDKFPVNPNGKLQRKVLRALALKRLGLPDEKAITLQANLHRQTVSK